MVTHGYRNVVCLNCMVCSVIVTYSCPISDIWYQNIWQSLRTGFSHTSACTQRKKENEFSFTRHTQHLFPLSFDKTPFLLFSGGLFLQETSWLYRHGAERSFRGFRWWCVTRALCLWYGLTCGWYLRTVACFSNMRVGQATPRFGDLLLKIISAK